MGIPFRSVKLENGIFILTIIRRFAFLSTNYAVTLLLFRNSVLHE